MSDVSALSRKASAAVRAEMGARRLTQRDLTERAGFRSHNYLAIRLRDEKSFTLDDVSRIAYALGCEPMALILGAPKQNTRGGMFDTYKRDYR